MLDTTGLPDELVEVLCCTSGKRCRTNAYLSKVVLSDDTVGVQYFRVGNDDEYSPALTVPEMRRWVETRLKATKEANERQQQLDAGRSL